MALSVAALVVGSALALAAQATPDLEITEPIVVSNEPEAIDLRLGIVPVPMTYFGGHVELAHTPGPLDHYALVGGGFSWFGKEVYDPREVSPAPVGAYSLPAGGLLPYPEVKARYGLNLTRQIRIYLQGRYVGSNLEANLASWLAKEEGRKLDAHYDPDALVAGTIATLGPHVEADFTDDPEFPTAGLQARAAATFGPAWLGNRNRAGAANDFARYQARVAQFFPFGEDMTLALSAVGGYGAGNVPVYLRYSAGGANYLRGYRPDRFAGDRLLVGSAEWRHLVLPGLLELGDIGLSYHAFADIGRVWETTCPTCTPVSAAIAFPGDVRGGIGAGIGLMSGRSTVLRFDVAVGNEGVVNYPAFGGALEIPLVPGFGMSLSESW